MDTLKTPLMVDFLKSYYKIFKKEKFKDDTDYIYVHLNFNLTSKYDCSPDPILGMSPNINYHNESEEVTNSEFIHECLENAYRNMILNMKNEIEDYFDKKLKN